MDIWKRTSKSRTGISGSHEGERIMITDDEVGKYKKKADSNILK